MRIALGAVLGIPLLLVLVVLAGLAYLQTGAGERWLAGQIEDAIGTPAAPARVAGLDVSWPLDLRATEIAIADHEGEWLRLQNLALDWSPLRLVGGTFAADRLVVERILVERRPLPAPAAATDAPAAEPGLDPLPRLRVAVDIRHIAAELVATEAVTGTPARLRLAGQAALTAQRGDVVLEVERVDGEPGRGHVLVDYDRPAERLRLDVDVPEAVGAVLTQLVPGAQLPPMALRIAGEGPLTDWRGTVLASTGGQPCIDAVLHLSGRDELEVQIEGEALPQCLPPQIGQAFGGTAEAPELERGGLMPHVRLAALAQEAAPEAAPPARAGLGEGAIRFRGGATMRDGEVRMGEVEIDSPLGTFSFTGSIVGEELSGRFAMGSDDVARLAAQAGIEMTGQATLEGTVSGTRAAPVIEAELQSPQGAAYGVAWERMQARFDVRRVERPEGETWLVDIHEAAADVEAAERGQEAPEAARLRLAGQAALAEPRAQVALDLERMDESGTGQVQIDYRRIEERLQLDIDVSEPVGAVLTQLFPAAEIPPMAMRISGAGPLTDWQGTILASTDGRPCIDAAVRLSGGDEIDFQIEGEALPECLPPQIGQALGAEPVEAEPAPEPVAPERHGFLGGYVQLAALAQEAPPAAQPAERPGLGEGAVRFRGGATVRDGQVQVDEVELETPLGAFRFSGSIVGDQLSGEFALGSEDVARLAAQAGIEMAGEALVTGTVAGTLGAPVISAQIQSAEGAAFGIAWRELQARLDLRRQAAGGSWLADLDGNAAAVEGLPEPITGPVRLAATGAFDQAAGVIRLGNLRLVGGGRHLSMFGVIRDWGADTALHGILRSQDLNLLSEALGVGMDGRKTLRFTVRGDLLTPDARVAFAGKTAGFTVGVDQVDALFGAAPGLSGAAAVAPGGLSILRARVAGQAATLRAAGTLMDSLALGWRLDIPDLAALPDAGLTGTARAAGYMLGSPDLPNIGTVLRAEGTAPGVPDAAQLIASISVQDYETVPRGLVRADLRTMGLLVEVQSGYVLDDDVALRGLQVRSGPDRLGGDLVWHADGLFSGRLQGELPDLSRWSDWIGQPLAGRLSFDATLAADPGQSVRADLVGSGLRLDEQRVGSLRGEVRLANVLTAPTGTARLTAENLVLAGQDLARASLVAQGDGTLLDFTLDAAGTGPRPLVVEARADWAPQPEEQVVRVSALRLRTGDITARLVEPTRLVIAEDAVTLAPALLDVGAGRMQLAGAVRQGVIDARLDVERMPMEMVAAFITDEPAQGVIGGVLTVTGPVERPQAQARFTGQNVGFGPIGQQRMNVELAATWADGIVNLQADAQGGPGVAARVTASFPLVVDDGLTVPPAGPLRAHVIAQGDLEPITDLLPTAGHRLAGLLQADIRLAGTVGQPVVDGEATLTGGYYEYFETGTVIQNLEARLSARDSQTFELRMFGSDGRTGQIGAAGTVRTTAVGLAYDIEVDLRDFRVVEVGAGTAQAGGNLMLSGQGDTGALSGRLFIGPGEYDIAGTLPGGAVPTIEVIEINRPGAPGPVIRGRPEMRTATAGGVDTPMTISLNVVTRVDRLFARGRGLESVWAGNMVIGGTLSDPRVVGELRAARGTYDLVGRRFELAESVVVFDGGPDLDPRLDILAEAEAAELVAQVRVAGTVNAPVIEFTSSPPFPEDEILSRLLFGRQMGQLGVAQQIQIARAAAAFAGGADLGFDPIGEIRRGLGLDLLELGADEDRGGLSPTIAIGRYLDDDTFVRIEEGGREGGEISIERQIGRGLSVTAEVGRRGGGGLGLSWRRDY